MRIAICDDDEADLEHICSILHRYKDKASTEMEITSFRYANDIITALRRGAIFDVMFLDVVMPGLNGIELAKELRGRNVIAQLVFITNSRDFAVDAFAVRAKDYLLKPIEESAVFSILDEICVSEEQKQCIVINSKSCIRKIYPHQLAYCEVSGHNVYWHMASGAVIDSIGTMKSVAQDFEEFPQFHQIHRSFLVNFDYISEFRRSDLSIEISGLCRLNVPRAKFTQVVDEYKLYLAAEETK